MNSHPKMNFIKLNIYAFKNGHLQMAQHLLEVNPTIFSLVSKHRLFQIGCYRGHLELVQWFLEKNPEFDFCKNIQSILEHVCIEGHLDVIKWLIQKFKKRNQPHLQWLISWCVPSPIINYDELFIRACSEGYLHIAKWLLQTNPTINTSVKNYYAFRHACCNKHLPVAQWLIEINPSIDISFNNEEVFLCACVNGNLEVAQWLLQTKPTIDIFIGNDEAFTVACYNGCYFVAQWLVSLCPEKYTIIGFALDGYKINYKIIRPLNILGTKYILFENVTECFICQNDNCDIITCCNHSFCKKCLVGWFEQKKNTCPICRYNLYNTSFREILITND